MEENNSIDFNEMLNNFISKINKKEEAERKNKVYVDEEEVKEKEKIKEETQNKLNVNIATHNFLNSQIEDLENKIKHTKFKKRFGYEANDEIQKIKFFLDNKVVFQLDYNDFLLYYNSGDLANEVIQEFYTMENSYTLIDFVEKQCFISDDVLKSRFRIGFKEFTREYIKYTENKFGADKLVNMKRITAQLKKCYNCDKIKYENEWQLNKITTLIKYKEQINKYSDYNVNEKKIFFDFVEKYCIVSDCIKPYERIKRSDFKKVYYAYLEKNNLNKYKLKNDQLKDILLHDFNENFIKSNGNYYMRKIKIKNLNK